MTQTSMNNPKYVYDLPYFERMELCRILDQNDKWEELGGIYMHFDMLTIQTLRREVLRGNSPADELLTKWGHQNHTILELFVLLSKMQHYQAMMTIKQFVDPEYHRLIYEGEQNFSRLFRTRHFVTCNKTDQNNQTLIPPVQPRSLTHDMQAHRQKVGNSVNAQEHTHDKQFVSSNNEQKILNNDCEFQPGRAESVNDNDAQTMLINKEENGLNTESNMLAKPKSKEDSGKDKKSVGVLPIITFKELEKATNGWNQSAILGKGGFGTVFKGTWKNTQVAIKRTKNPDTDENRTAQIQQILAELKMLNSYRHDNILPLYGFSSDSEEPCLIYQFMPNGSLEDRLLCRHGTKPLTWFQRHNIATGTARGLQFLHTIGEKPLIHGDIKSANILLDSNFEPKIGDFGLAREGPYSHYTHMKVSKVHGTRPYLPDEFLRHKKFSTKVDTHSFGIVLFELVTGLRAYDDQRTHKFLKDLIENCDESDMPHFIDKKCGADEHQIFPNIISLGKRCTSRKPKDRPEMVLVLEELNAMAVKRDTILKVQNIIKQSSLSPLNPHEIQILQEHLRQQKKISPVTSALGMQRAVTPPYIIHFSPDASRAVSPIVNDIHPVFDNNNPFLHFDPGKNDNRGTQFRESRSVSPNNNNGNNFADFDKRSLRKIPDIGQIHSTNNHRNADNAELRNPPPSISVSPPTAPQSSSDTSDEMSGQLHETNRIEEDFDYHYSSQFDNVLPLISELGIKKSEKKSEESTQDAEPATEINTSAKGKELWILHGPS